MTAARESQQIELKRQMELTADRSYTDLVSRQVRRRDTGWYSRLHSKVSVWKLCSISCHVHLNGNISVVMPLYTRIASFALMRGAAGLKFESAQRLKSIWEAESLGEFVVKLVARFSKRMASAIVEKFLTVIHTSAASTKLNLEC